MDSFRIGSFRILGGCEICSLVMLERLLSKVVSVRLAAPHHSPTLLRHICLQLTHLLLLRGYKSSHGVRELQDLELDDAEPLVGLHPGALQVLFDHFFVCKTMLFWSEVHYFPLELLILLTNPNIRLINRLLHSHLHRRDVVKLLFYGLEVGFLLGDDGLDGLIDFLKVLIPDLLVLVEGAEELGVHCVDFGVHHRILLDIALTILLLDIQLEEVVVDVLLHGIQALDQVRELFLVHFEFLVQDVNLGVHLYFLLYHFDERINCVLQLMNFELRLIANFLRPQGLGIRGLHVLVEFF